MGWRRAGKTREHPPPPTNPADGAPENIESTEGLNGAQIRAALDILDGVRSGSVASAVAVELLIALGIDRARAERMVSETVAQKGAQPTGKQPIIAAAQPQPANEAGEE